MVVRACSPGGKKGYRRSDLNKLRFASWNIGTLTGKSIELVKVLHRHKISIACVQETKWMGGKTKEIDEYKLWYSSLNKAKNGVDILVRRDLVEPVVDVKRKSDRIISVKLVVGSMIFNVVTVYAPQIRLGEDIKRDYSGRISIRFSEISHKMRKSSLEVTLMDI